jgi:hypothetical protein
MDRDPIPGLYEQLVTEDLKRLLNTLKPDQVSLDSPDTADGYIAIAEHLRRLIEQALHAIPEQERLKRQAELCNNLIAWLQREQTQCSASPGKALAVPVEMLREIRARDRTGVFSSPTRQPLVPLSSVDLLVNARDEPSIGSAIEHEIYSADRIDLLCAFTQESHSPRAETTQLGISNPRVSDYGKRPSELLITHKF